MKKNNLLTELEITETKENHPQNTSDPNNQPAIWISLGSCFGTALGSSFGLMLDNIALGMCLGICFGNLVGIVIYATKIKKEK